MRVALLVDVHVGPIGEDDLDDVGLGIFWVDIRDRWATVTELIPVGPKRTEVDDDHRCVGVVAIFDVVPDVEWRILVVLLLDFPQLVIDRRRVCVFLATAVGDLALTDILLTPVIKSYQ
ncbi:hypothetical protein [Natrinema altunense]|uniref:Uncharacterized protein n=1 Tax=Natrinema altunense (strain JCM 12890 / CGMCC 1.3731 / AJ2) TaxID=1227494 RepID=L9ZNT5_NATA2|nr:hypothetical protein [Natrinema altunense]ELY86828.1 hypothetical protein C485_07927 [Natrinema altunense JCM 12890]